MSAAERVGDDDAMPFTRLISMGPHTFQASVDSARAALVLAPLKQGTAVIDLPCQPQRLMVTGDDAASCIAMYDPGSTVTVPAGHYAVYRYIWERKTPAGDTWRLAAEGQSTSEVAVATGGRASLPLGEPYVPTISARASTRLKAGLLGALFGGSRVDTTLLEFRLVGAGGETVKSVACTSDCGTSIPTSTGHPDYPKEPTYRIMKVDGEIVAQGSFEYG